MILIVGTQAGTSLFRSISSRFQKVSVTAFGVGLELTETVAKEVQYNVREGFEEYRKRINSEFDRQVRIKQIDEKLAAVVEEVVKTKFAGKAPPEYRCTIHVPDVLFSNTLYQLVDYYPRGGGRGRTFSNRAGMIGKTWRLQESQAARDVFDGGKTTEELLKDLLRDWAMTRPEAGEAAQNGIRAFVTVLLTEEPSSVPIGILYFDSKKAEAFGDDTAAKTVGQFAFDTSSTTGLTKALAEIGEEMRKIGPAISISR